ncbi:organomercurial lyase [Chelativorans salis]|uniref:Organomercurial lyase n=1 Tax=Chelativorans salis TaxID=2978478 RepID=A0ABT2LSB1_9HYPH|nr:organomercurial lyase [Chelativorans sp. EGI FJ00035]MCT7376979.1 organomercurial lyase [Chelativorans sp. EGI FJ00035]
MTRSDKTVHDDLWDLAVQWLPVFSLTEQHAGIVLLRELAKGEAVTCSRLAQALGTTFGAAEALMKDSALCPFIYTDERDRIIGFWGLSVAPTHHQITVKGQRLWTWCAYDSLFIPELLGETAEIESRDPESNELIRLTVSPERIISTEPADIVVSMGRPDTWDQSSAARIIATACHHIYFFVSRASGERWQAKHTEPATILLSLDVAFDFGKRSNAHLFQAELTEHRKATA